MQFHRLKTYICTKQTFFLIWNLKNKINKKTINNNNNNKNYFENNNNNNNYYSYLFLGCFALGCFPGGCLGPLTSVIPSPCSYTCLTVLVLQATNNQGVVNYLHNQISLLKRIKMPVSNYQYKRYFCIYRKYCTSLFYRL